MRKECTENEIPMSSCISETIGALVEEASSVLSCSGGIDIQTFKEEIFRSLRVITDPMHLRCKEDFNRTLALHLASVRSNIGNIKFALNEYETAFTFYDAAFQMRRKVLGSTNLTTGVTAFHAGRCLHCVGKTELALRHYQVFVKAVFSSTKRRRDRVTQEMVLMLQSIAWAFLQENSCKHANTFYLLTLKAAGLALEKDHEVIPQILNQFGNLRFELGDLKTALVCYDRSVHIAVSNLVSKAQAKEDPISRKRNYFNVLTTISNMAKTYEEMGDFELSLKCFRRMTELLKSKECLGSLSDSDVNRTVSDIFSDLARVLVKLRKFDKALKALTEVLRIRKKEYGIDHTLVATTLNDMGIAYGSKGQLLPALRCFEETLGIREKLSKDSYPHANIATVLSNIARLHHHSGCTTKALVYYQKVVDHELLRRGDKEAYDNDLSYSSSEILLDALEQMAVIYQDDLDNPISGIRCYEKGISLILEDGSRIVSYDVHSRYLCKTGDAYLKIGNQERAAHFFTRAMRINVAGGLAFNANIKATGYDIYKLECIHLHAAPAA